MKFYETHFEDYCKSVEKYNIHPEIADLTERAQTQPQNWIVYGPPGVGKYSQVLTMLKPYSPSLLKYDKKIKITTEKHAYRYRMSDIHFEIDMSLLGCNSKILWHEIYNQILDIVSIRPEKIGFIVCKNFHHIHNELLEIFYSYMQKYCHGYDIKCRDIQIYFILITEHLSFMPNNILNHCSILRVGRPRTEDIAMCCRTNKRKEEAEKVIREMDLANLTNIKEVYSFSLIQDMKEIPADHFNTVCDSLIQQMYQLMETPTPSQPTQENQLSLTQFRDSLYDILIFNLDGLECIWYIYQHFVEDGRIQIDSKENRDCLYKLTTIFKQYGNNYRSIFHLENAVFTIMQATMCT